MLQGQTNFCNYHPTVLATRMLPAGKGSVCEECWRLICIGKDPAKAAAIAPSESKTPASEAAPMSKEKTKLFCKTQGCNTSLRSDNKSGFCTKCQQNRGTGKKRGPYTKRTTAGVTGSGHFSGVIATLREKRDQIDRVITDLEELN